MNEPSTKQVVILAIITAMLWCVTLLLSGCNYKGRPEDARLTLPELAEKYPLRPVVFTPEKPVEAKPSALELRVAEIAQQLIDERGKVCQLQALACELNVRVEALDTEVAKVNLQAEEKIMQAEARLAKLHKPVEAAPPLDLSPIVAALDRLAAAVARPKPMPVQPTKEPPPGLLLKPPRPAKVADPPPGLLPKVTEKPKPAPVVPTDIQVVAYSAKWCGPCKTMHPIWDAIKRRGVAVRMIDCDFLPEGDYKPTLIPYTIVYRGSKIIGEWHGVIDQATIDKAVEEAKTAKDDQSSIPSGLGRVTDSPVDQRLVAYAQASADLQARLNRQGHHNWESRFHAILAATGYGTIKEICNESWADKQYSSDAELWTEFFQTWRKADRNQMVGHWGVANSTHKAYGYGMAKGTNNVWYAAILAAD